MARYAHVTGWGMAVPDKILTNQELEKMVETTDEWIVARTGIRERRIVSAHETTASLATLAARNALAHTALDPRDIELIIVATASPDEMLAPSACLVQDNLGAVNAGAFDLNAACTGFIYAVNMAAQSIRSGSISNAIVIGSETLSRFINWEDRNTCVLFGDGAGAFVLQGSNTPGGILSCVLRSDGSGGDLLHIPAGGSKTPATFETVENKLHTIHMNGREVFRFATRVMASSTHDATQKAGLTMDDIDLIVPHQANRRIIEAAARVIHFPMNQIVMNIENYGNTSTASIPIAICEALEEGRINPGDNMVLVGFGAGLTWGALVMQWMEQDITVSSYNLARRKVMTLLARLRSLGLRILRRLEGLIWGASSKKTKS